MEEHKKCPNYKDCPYYSEEFDICNRTSGLVGNKTCRCWIAYDRWKTKEMMKK